MKKTLKSQATLAVLLAVVVVLGSVSALVASLSYNHYSNVRASLEATQALLLADSAMEESLLGLHRNINYSSNTFTVPEGTVDIQITSLGGNSRQVVVTHTGDAWRQITANLNIEGQSTLAGSYSMFAGDAVQMVKSHAMLVGNLWTNDNVSIDDNTIVQGNVTAVGAGNASDSQVSNGGRVEDNPTTAEIEGNLTVIDKIRIINSGFVQGLAKSSKGITTSSGGYAGSTEVDPSLAVETLPIPSRFHLHSSAPD